MNPIIPIAILVMVTGFVIWITVMIGRKRTSAWEGISLRLGARFIPKDSDVHTRFPFQLFNTGSRRRMKNHLQWESEGVVFHLGDYQYTTYHSTGSGRSSKTHKQTVCILQKEGIDLPSAVLRRQVALLDWFGEKFGAQDINFDEDPEFSKTFVLKGDESRAPMIFGPDMRSHLLSNRKNFRTTEMSGDALMINFGKLRKPEEYGELVQVAMPVYYMAIDGGQGW